MNGHVAKLRAAQAVAPIVLHQDAQKTMDDLMAVWIQTQADYNAKSLEALRAEVIKTMTRLTIAAKRDLLVRPGAGEETR
jgi:hypothetical protein